MPSPHLLNADDVAEDLVSHFGPWLRFFPVMMMKWWVYPRYAPEPEGMKWTGYIDKQWPMQDLIQAAGRYD